jgi:hypothetical protein
MWVNVTGRDVASRSRILAGPRFAKPALFQDEFELAQENEFKLILNLTHLRLC